VIVWLARHGEAAWPRGAALGWSDPSLSRLGEDQAGALAERLAGRPIAAVHSSNLRRALATAEALAAPHRLAVEVTSDLRELGFGAWEGRRLGDLWHEEPAEARVWEADIRRTPSSFAESVPDLERRVAGFARALQRSGLDQAEEVAVVAHRGSLAALHAILSGGEFGFSFRSLPFDLAGEVQVRC
jgi:broad specificity phosphatase PhoE